MDATGWTSELPRIPGAAIELHDGVLNNLHEGMDGSSGWVPLEQEYGPEHEAEWWRPLLPPSR